MSDWRVLVAETMSGRIVGEVTPSAVPSFRRRITDPGQWTVDTALGYGGNRITDLHTWTEARRYSWAVCWGETVCQAGPVRTTRVDDEQRTLSVSGVGIAGELERRVVRHPHGHTAITHPSEDLIIRDVSARGLVTEILRANLAQPGYRLPIILPETERGPESVTYRGYDLASVWDRIRDVAHRDNGPDVDLRPVLTQDGRAVEWVLDLGNPRVGRSEPPYVWDYGAAVHSIHLDIDGSSTPATRVWAKGAGSQRNLRTGFADNPSLPVHGVPPVDIVDTTHSAERRQDVLASYARATLDRRRIAPSRWETTLRLPRNPGTRLGTAPGEWMLGDCPLIGVHAHPWLADGHYRRRVTGVSNDSETTLAVDLEQVR